MSTPEIREPTSFNRAAAWSPSTLEADSSWIYTLGYTHSNELKTALVKFKAFAASHGKEKACRQGRLLPSKVNFPLPTLGPLLVKAQQELEEHYGAVLFKNFPLDCSEEDARLMYGGLVSYIGTAQPQTIRGELLQPVQDEGQAMLDERRGSKHNLGLPIHNDGCDVVGFLCRRTPLSGGTSILVSAVSVHDALLKNQPGALQTLYRPYHNAWQDYMFPEGKNTQTSRLPRTWEAPVFSTREGKICCRYSRFYTDRAQTFPGVQKMTAGQISALDALDSCLHDQENYQYRRQFEAGDVLFLNNHIVLHSRTCFTDGETIEQRRQLYRAWISVPNSRPLDESLKCFFSSTEAGSIRGGVKKEFMLDAHEADAMNRFDEVVD